MLYAVFILRIIQTNLSAVLDTQTSIRLILISVLFGFLFLMPVRTLAQVNTDATEIQESIVVKHSPRKAALYSTLLPGLGQVYNKKYWKVPVLYAGIVALTYFTIDNHKKYREYFNGYAALSDTISGNDVGYPLTKEQYLYYKDSFRRYRDMDILLLVALYVINIVDATVDAHFFDFDIDDNLSLNIRPFINTFPNKDLQTVGVNLNIRF